MRASPSLSLASLLPLVLLTSVPAFVSASPVERSFPSSTLKLVGSSPASKTTVDGIVDFKLVEREVSKTIEKYAHLDKAKARKRSMAKVVKARATSVELVNPENDAIYPGAMTVGTPAQTVLVIFDTGSADVWVSDGVFDSTKSSTFRDSGSNVSISYVSGTFEGAVARDTISVGALSVANQDLAVTPASSLSDSSPFSGIIGLAFPSVSKIGKPTLLENLVAAGTLKNNLFSFYFSRNGTSGSELTLGGVDPDKHTGGFLRAPVVSESHWTIMTSEVLVDRKKIKNVNVATSIDTGSSVSYMPTTQVAAIFAAIPGSVRLNSTTSATVNGVTYVPSAYAFPCSTTSRVGFVFAGTTSKKVFDMDPQDLSLGALDAAGTYCTSSLFGVDIEMSGVQAGLLGLPFLKSWVSVWHVGSSNNDASIGFARSKA